MDYFSGQDLRIFDGAIGTEVQKRSGEGGDNLTDSFNLTEPDIVREIHLSYLEAGAQCLTTNTFSSNEIRLAKSGYEGDRDELNEKGAKLARSAIDEFSPGPEERGKFVAGSIGPTGETLVPLGDYYFGDYYQAFLEQSKSLARGGADCLIIETMESIREAKAALVAAKEVGLPVISSMSYGNHGRTSFGVVPEAGAVTLERAGADVLGMNCGTGPGPYPEIIQSYNEHTSLPLLAEANAGNPKLKKGKMVYEITPEEYFEKMKPGLPYLSGVGSCCGSDPSFTRLLASVSGKYTGVQDAESEENKRFIASSSSVVDLNEIDRLVEVELAVDDLPGIKDELQEKGINLLKFTDSPSSKESFEGALSRTFLQLRTSKPIGIVANSPQVLEAFFRAYPGLPPVAITGKTRDYLELVDRYGGLIVD